MMGSVSGREPLEIQSKIAKINKHSYRKVAVSGDEFSGDDFLFQSDHLPSEAADGNAVKPPQFVALKRVSVSEIILLTCFNFPYGLICGTMGLFILPAEAMRLRPQTSSVTLGISLLVVGVSQLICPLAGRMSDAWTATSPVGKRQPFMIWGCVVGVTSVLGMWFCSLAKWAIFYYANLFLGMMALNIIYSVQCGLVPDFVDEADEGKSSGIVAVHGVLGSGLGFALMIATTSWDFHLVYPLYSVMTILTVVVSLCTAARLQSRHHHARIPPIDPDVRTFDLHDDIHPPVNNQVASPPTATTVASSTPSPMRMYPLVEHNGSPPPESRLSHGTRSVNADIRIHHRSSNDASHIDSRIHHRSNDGFRHAKQNSDAEYRHAYSVTSPDRRSSFASQGDYHDDSLTSTPNDDDDNIHHNTYTDGVTHDNIVKNARFMNLSCREVLEAYTIDTSKSWNFFWVFIGRTFYYVGVSVTAFIMFFLRDVVGTTDQAQRRLQIGCIALLAQGTAACIAYPMGRLSDKPHVGKKPLIFAACFCMSLVYVGFLVCPVFGEWAFLFVLSVSVLYGAANGCFLAVDYGLALATLPDKNQAAQALGVWGVSAFIGSAVGPLLWGALIQFFGGEGVSMSGIIGSTGGDTDNETRFGYPGYVAMLLGGILATILAGILIHFVKLKDGVDEAVGCELPPLTDKTKRGKSLTSDASNTSIVVTMN